MQNLFSVRLLMWTKLRSTTSVLKHSHISICSALAGTFAMKLFGHVHALISFMQYTKLIVICSQNQALSQCRTCENFSGDQH